MTGYCEVCQREAEADEEEPTPVCAKCGHDLIHGFGIDDPYDAGGEEGWLLDDSLYDEE